MYSVIMTKFFLTVFHDILSAFQLSHLSRLITIKSDKNMYIHGPFLWGIWARQPFTDGWFWSTVSHPPPPCSPVQLNDCSKSLSSRSKPPQRSHTAIQQLHRPFHRFDGIYIALVITTLPISIGLRFTIAKVGKIDSEVDTVTRSFEIVQLAGPFQWAN